MAKSLSWSLVECDIEKNLIELASLPESPSHACVAKIYEFYNFRANNIAIRDAVLLLGEINLSTTSVEPAHGSTSQIHNFHPVYNLEALCVRSLVHQLRSWFVPAQTERRALQLENA